jgi:membrane-associated phospholipid phosphatase
VKVRSFPGPRVLAASVAQGRTLVRASARIARRNPGWAVAASLTAAALLALVFPRDHAWLATIHGFRGHAETIAHGLAWQLGLWGDYPTYNLPVTALLWGWGIWKKDRALRRIAMICFLGATVAGLFNDCFRLTLGRPRPDAYHHPVDGFYGPAKALLKHFQSFPSGHAASDVGMGVALLVVNRGWGLLACAYALLVIWGRLELNKHFPSDVLIGSVIGLYFGAVIGAAGKLRRGAK